MESEAKTGGDVLLPANFTLGGDNGSLTGTGHIRNTGGKLIVNGLTGSQRRTVNFAETIDDVELVNLTNLNVAQHLSINNTLRITRVDTIGGANLKVSGDVTSNDASYSGTSFVSLVGSTDQSLLGTGTLRFLDIAKTSGDVLMSTFSRNFNQVTVSAGQWDVLGNTVAATSGFIAQGGKITGAGTLTGGTIAVPATGTMTIGSGGALGGTLTVRANVTASSGGTISSGNSPGTTTINGNLVMNAGSTLFQEINGASFDQLIVNGAVSLGNATLSGNTTAVPSGPITIIANDLADAVSGTFSGLPANSIVTIGSTKYQIKYNGDTGNDVTLTPALLMTVALASVTVNEGQTASNSGT